VAAGGDHAAFSAADDDRHIPQLRPVALLDTRVEGVAIHVGDGQGPQVLVRHDPRAGAGRAAADRLLALPEAVAAEGFHGSSGQSQAAPRTPEEWPCRALRTGVVKTSEKV